MAKEPKPITFGDFYKGITQSKYAQNGFDSLIGVDIHSETGSVKSSLARIKESGSTVTELCKVAFLLPNGDSFWGSSTSGKIWKRTYAGVWSLVHTNTNGACIGMGYHRGYLYYASATKLGRIAEANASSEATWSSQNDSWQDFLNDDAYYHTMFEQNLSLFIADKSDIAAVDNADGFSQSVLDLQTQYEITSFTSMKSDLLAGFKGLNYLSKGGAVRWDTYSSSWLYDDYVEEGPVNMWIKLGQYVIAQIGAIGNLYPHNGEGFETIFTALRDGDTIVSTDILPYGTANLNGLALINTTRGIFSLGKRNVNLPLALNIEYIPSVGQGITPGAIIVIGGQVLSAWKKTGTPDTFGVDKLDTNRCNGQVITPVVLGPKKVIRVHYSDMPTGCSIGIETKKDRGSSWDTHISIKDDTDKKIVYFDGGIGNRAEVQGRITLNSNGAATPIVTLIEFE
jgi:hypothetical protein